MYRRSMTAPTAPSPGELVEAWGALFGKYVYDHFTTHTFRRPDTSEERARRDFTQLVARLERRAGGAVAHAAVFAESSAGHIHVHALLKGTAGVPVLALRRCWPHGFSHVEKYDPAQGARHYLAHHIDKPGQRMLGDFEFASREKFIRAAGRLPPRRVLRPYLARNSGRLWFVVARDALGRLRTTMHRAA